MRHNVGGKKAGLTQSGFPFTESNPISYLILRSFE